MKWWLAYKLLVEKNTVGNSLYENKALTFWRDKLFANIILYLLPISFLALVPGVIMSFIDHIPLLAFYDLMAFACFALIAFHPTLRLFVRKIILVVCLYLLSIILLMYLGSFGPGLLYLLALTVFIALIFPVSIALWTVVANLVICLLFTFIIHFRLLDNSLVQLYTLGSWIAVSSNLIILSTVIVASIHLLFNGLQETIEKEATLQNELRKESHSLEQMLQKMEIKNAELEQFAYIASHDLQEPLTTMASVVALFEKQYKNKLDVNDLTYLNFLSLSATHMQALITGLLDYSRIGKDRETELVDCNQILRDVIFDFDELIIESNAEIIIGSLPSFQAFSVELKQMFENLISNAVKFRRQEVRLQISVHAREEKDEYIFMVKDNGIGIEEKFYKKIFIIFQRLHTKSKYTGIGVGLAHCKKIAELHAGKIWVESIPHQGSTFYFTISKDYHSYGNKIKEHSAY